MAHDAGPVHLFSGLLETSARPFGADYASYVENLGRSIGEPFVATGAIGSDPHYRHSIAVRSSVRRALTAERLDIVVDRLADEDGFDLVVMTNVLPYLDDRQLALALTNVAAMLRPGGFLLHNESRAGLAEIAASVKLPALHMRTAVIAGSGDGALYDTIWLHRSARTS